MSYNLNNLRTENHEDDGFYSAKVKVFFEDIEEKLLAILADYDYVVGCVAWMTNENILKLMLRMKSVSIIVQKEDLYRSDSWKRRRSARKIRSLYDRLPGTITREEDLLFTLAGKGLKEGEKIKPIEAVRCMGFYNRSSSPAAPRLHHKFLVFCEKEELVIEGEGRKSIVSEEFTIENIHNGTISASGGLRPVAVWTGSFNFSYSAGLSFENAVFIDDERIAEKYFKEYCQALLLSEPIDWLQDEPKPDMRDKRDHGSISVACRYCGEYLGIKNPSFDDALVWEPYCFKCMRTVSGCKVLECERCMGLYSDETPREPGEKKRNERKWAYDEDLWVINEIVEDDEEKKKMLDKVRTKHNLPPDYMPSEDPFSYNDGPNLCSRCEDEVFGRED
ncbi:MAG TPA: hypothetical protein VFV38_18690 [Ktedonobacteraceae bacterium]|nr:hypothetical protein [Ktedonobacteraceae bacterium]